jgi:hypothetical protein
MSEMVINKVLELMKSGLLGDVRERLQETPMSPLIVTKPSGDVHSWLVPLTVKDRLVGYVQLNERLEMMKHSSLRRKMGSIEGTPLFKNWFDPDRVLERAASIAKPDEKLSPPVLTYDQYPDRLAWRIEARSTQKKTRYIMVIGDAVYEQVDLKDTIGG